MNDRLTWLAAAALTAGWSTVANADGGQWQHTVVLYAMGAAIDGESTIGDLTVPVDVSMSEVFDALEVLQRQGYDVQLARCGKVYQLSTAKWYRIAGPGKRTVVLLRNVRCDTVACPKGQESYTLALDGRLPPLQAGEVEASGGRCPGR